jgi:hypothetical protein
MQGAGRELGWSASARSAKPVAVGRDGCSAASSWARRGHGGHAAGATGKSVGRLGVGAWVQVAAQPLAAPGGACRRGQESRERRAGEGENKVGPACRKEKNVPGGGGCREQMGGG